MPAFMSKPVIDWLPWSAFFPKDCWNADGYIFQLLPMQYRMEAYLAKCCVFFLVSETENFACAVFGINNFDIIKTEIQ